MATQKHLTPEERDELRAYNRAWRDQHRDEINRRARERRASHPEKARALDKKKRERPNDIARRKGWRQRHPGKQKSYAARYNSSEKGKSRRTKQQTKNRQYLNNKQRNWRDANPEKVKEGNKQQWSKHRDKNIERKAKKRASNIAAARAYERDWSRRRWHGNANYRESKLHRARRHRANRTGPHPLFSKQDKAEIFASGCCFYCGVSGVELTEDHVVALTKGGADSKENIVAACRSCNSSKRAKPLEAWLASGGRIKRN
jgi:hypothetical protein